jgi:DNA-directed RNA polymerase specialized sigma24 family protein
VFLVLLRTLQAFAYDHGQSFRAWLYTVFANRWRDACRKRVPVPLVDGSSFPVPAVDDPTAAVGEAEYRAVLVARAARLIETDFNPTTWQAFRATAVEVGAARLLLRGLHRAVDLRQERGRGVLLADRLRAAGSQGQGLGLSAASFRKAGMTLNP